MRRLNKPCWIVSIVASGCLASPVIASVDAPVSIATTETTDVATLGGWSDSQGETVKTDIRDNPHATVADYHGSIELYEQTIAAIEDQHGVYDASLVQQVMGLGLAQQSQGRNQESVDSFKRALHLSRINDGLYNLAQAPILRHLITSYEAQNDWDSANDRQTYLYTLQRRHYGYSDPRLLEPIVNMVEWHLKAFTQGASAEPDIHLLQARALNGQAIRIIEENFGGEDVRLSEALYRQALTNYQLAVVQASHSTGPLAPSGRQLESAYATSDVQNAVVSLNPYSEGKRALRRRVELIQANPEISSISKLMALIHLGDWYFMFNKRDSAMRTYRRAQSTFANDEATKEDLKKIFGKPHVLSFYRSTQQRVPESDKTGYVEAVFNITSSGRAQRIQIVDSNPPNVMDSTVQRSLKATRYRPRFVEGVPVSTKGVSYRHIFEVEPES